jgi:hypothetical protein
VDASYQFISIQARSMDVFRPQTHHHVGLRELSQGVQLDFVTQKYLDQLTPVFVGAAFIGNE